MGVEVVGCALSADVLHLTSEPEGRVQIRASADELLGALWAGYTHASEFYRANPTTERWRELVRAHACWKVAFLAEEDGGRP